MESFSSDLRFALRSLVKSPGYALATIVTLALGIGANTAIFSLVNGVLLEPLPYRESGRLVLLQQSAPKADVENLAFSIKEVYDYRDANETLEALVEHHSMTFTLLGREEPERVSTGVVTAEFFDVLGVTPQLGRNFRPEDDDLGAEPVLILSNGYWQRSFGGDESVIGRALEMNDKTHTVVGVLPPIPQFPVEHDVYMPTSACPFRANAETRMNENRSAFRALTAFGRIKEGIEIANVRSDFGTIASRFEHDYPETYPAEQGLAITATPLQQALTSGATTMLMILVGTSVLVLFIACANVANLAVARLMRRDREIAIRTSLGAGMGKLLRQNLAESAILSLLGGLLGLLVAYLGLDLLTSFIARFTPRAVSVDIDGRVLAFTLGVSLLTALVVALLPILTARPSPAAALRDGGHTTEHRRRIRLRGLLIAAQVAVAVVLLVGAGLMLRSLYRLHQVQPGFRTENILIARITPNFSLYPNPEDAPNFFRSLLERVRAIPGVESAGAGSVRPLDGNPPFTNGFRIENIPIEEGQIAPQVATRTATPDYFSTLGIPLLRGRSFTDGDDAEATPVGVINQSLAEQFWKERSPLGERVSINNGQRWITVVGIVADVRDQSLDAEPMGAIYLPQAQSFWAQTLVVRTPFDPMRIARDVKEAVYAVQPQQSIDRLETLEQSRSQSMASPRVTALLLALFAGLALVISATGIAGVIAYVVSQRTHEIGIRMALGAKRGQVLSMILRQGLVIVVVGMALGTLGAIAASRVLSGVLFETSATDPVTFVGVLAVLFGAALLASFVPARRAATIHPTIALRSE